MECPLQSLEEEFPPCFLSPFFPQPTLYGPLSRCMNNQRPKRQMGKSGRGPRRRLQNHATKKGSFFMWPSPSPILRSSSNLAKQGIGPFLASTPLCPPSSFGRESAPFTLQIESAAAFPLFLLNFQPLSIHFPPPPILSLRPRLRRNIGIKEWGGCWRKGREEGNSIVDSIPNFYRTEPLGPSSVFIRPCFLVGTVSFLQQKGLVFFLLLSPFRFILSSGIHRGGKLFASDTKPSSVRTKKEPSTLSHRDFFSHFPSFFRSSSSPTRQRATATNQRQ